MPLYTIINTSDTIQNNLKLNINSNQSIGIKPMRNTIELSSLRRISDTTRKVVKPQPIKITKVPAVIKQIDTLQTPVYNTITGKFDFPTTKTELFDYFYFTKPNADIPKRIYKKTEKSVVAKHTSTKEKPKESVVKPQSKPQEYTEIKKPEVVQKDLNASLGFAKTDWILGFLIFFLFVYGWLNFRFGKHIKSLFEAGYNFFATKKLQEVKNVVRSNVFKLLNIMFFIHSAFLLTLWAEFYHINILQYSSLMVFVVFLLIIIGLYLVKSISFAFLDFVFLTRNAFLQYNYTVFLYNKIYGILILPLLFIIPFVATNIAQTLFLLSFILFGLLYVARLFRGFKICIKNKISIFYLILYLCTLEIIPLLIICHTITEYLL